MFINHNHQHYNLLLVGILLAVSFSLSSCSNDDNPAEDPALPSTYDSLKPIGFGENTTGGNGQNIILVTTADQLAAAVSGTDPATVYVQGHISIDKMLSVGSNKTILGLSGATISNLNRNENAGIFQRVGGPL